MFPLHQGNELCFQISSNAPHKIPQDIILPHPVLYGSPDLTDDLGKSRRRKSISMDNDETARDNGNNKKKLLHRDIERQRRQEMATLYASLRSLLPLEHIKGKRSISDHMNEAVNYIKHLQKRIKELDAKKNELKQKTNFRDIPLQSSGSSSNCSPSTGVIIRPNLGGMEIVFSSGFREQDLTLSGALQLLLEAELSVVNCVSTKVNERLFHTVQAEVKDSACLNLSGLQQKLNPLVP
ncbi:transcription factor bHLH126-like [Hevea brasiliensis]|uniref:transcription factor bHLH126-like n=1 Tax=Hevea brasiliensis TaxID=3981 RepID=UPI0025ECCC75|nr:transcription factor bHLH126-like [Hevea brasiliensis]